METDRGMLFDQTNEVKPDRSAGFGIGELDDHFIVTGSGCEGQGLLFEHRVCSGAAVDGLRQLQRCALVQQHFGFAQPSRGDGRASLPEREGERVARHAAEIQGLGQGLGLARLADDLDRGCAVLLDSGVLAV